jgi:excisionase family DNA binding protein
VRTHCETRSTFRSLARGGGAMMTDLDLITHPSPSEAKDLYTRLEEVWPAICRPVECIRITPKDAPVASSGEVTSRVTFTGERSVAPPADKKKAPDLAGLEPSSVPALLAGCTGLEPVASGVTVGARELAGTGRSVQTPADIDAANASYSSASLEFGPISRPPVTLELQTRCVKSVPAERLLTVRQVADRLGVSKAMVYRLCGEGKLLHVRVSNAIRVAPEALDRLVGHAAREPLRRPTTASRTTK